MEIIIGRRLYEQTATGKYPKYNLTQMNRFVAMDCPSYSGIQVVCNVKCFDLFGKYQDEITPEQKQILDEKIKEEYGLQNVDIDHLIDWEKFEYNKEKDLFYEKIPNNLR